MESVFSLHSQEDIPEWISEGNWVWHPWTSVFGSGTPDGQIISETTGEKFQLDFITVDCGFFDSIVGDEDLQSVNLAAQLLAWEAWEAGHVAVLHEKMYGAATLLVPGASFTYDMFFSALYRFCSWLGMEERTIFSCSAEVPLPHQLPDGAFKFFRKSAP